MILKQSKQSNMGVIAVEQSADRRVVQVQGTRAVISKYSTDVKQLPRNEEKAITKREVDAEKYSKANALLLKDEFEAMQLQKKIAREAEENQQNDVLEMVQEQVAFGEYHKAIQSIGAWLSCDSPNSSFKCDLHFYETISLCIRVCSR